MRLDDPAHYGRIVRDERDNVARIIEYRDASPDEREIDEINVGLYVFRSDALRPALARLGSDNAQGELYLTDVVHLLIDAEHVVATFESDDEEMCMGVNSRVELVDRQRAPCLGAGSSASRSPACRSRIRTRTYVDWGVEVGRDTMIRANTHLLGRTTIGAASEIGPGCVPAATPSSATARAS